MYSVLDCNKYQRLQKAAAILNICDQPANLLRSYCRLLNVDLNEFDPVYVSLNHFDWFTYLYNQAGEDLATKL